jgi:hypothetical protein
MGVADAGQVVEIMVVVGAGEEPNEPAGVHLPQPVAVAVVQDGGGLGQAVQVVVELLGKTLLLLGCQRLERLEQLGVVVREAVVVLQLLHGYHDQPRKSSPRRTRR